jgi:quercetin dioxygenase-like cupin family protein
VLEREVRSRITACAEQAVDLASIAGDRRRIAKARSALARQGRARADALELLEEVLPKAFARRTLSVLELDGSRRSASDERTEQAQLALAADPWLDTCARYDRGALSSPEVVSLIDKLIVLGESSLFSGMTSEELYPLGEIAVAVDLEPGQAAVRQGEPGDAVYVVVSGQLEVKKNGQSLREVSRGAVFGEMALLDGAPRSASIEARTPARVLKIPRAEFDALLDEYPEIARGIIRTLIGDLRGQG